MGNLSSKFGSTCQDWATPDEIFLPLVLLHQFTLDVCATPENARCARFFTKDQDGLSQTWGGERCWMNPPFFTVGAWVKKASEEYQKGTPCIVGLLPARTNTEWFHRYLLGQTAIQFIRGRIRFKGATYPLPQPLMITHWGVSPFISGWTP